MPERTCLFTNEPLSEDTLVEHTIPRGLGGRCRSRIVCSSTFNGMLGSRVDHLLIGVYKEAIAVLGPCLPTEFLGGDIPVDLGIDDGGQYVVDNQGRLTLRNTVIANRDEVTQRPTSILATDEGRASQILQQVAPPGARFSRDTVLAPSNRAIATERPAQSPEIEVAALRSILLTFDHLLSDSDQPFTRSDELSTVRQLVRRFVENGSFTEEEIREFADVSLGIQYEAEREIEYQSLLDESGLTQSPFHHTLIVSANSVTQIIDAMFWIFGCDPFAFRLASNWSGQTFTTVVVNGVLRDTELAHASLNTGRILGRPTARRCFIRAAENSESVRTRVRTELFGHRRDLYRRAVDYVERNRGDIVAQQILLAAKRAPDINGSVLGAMRRRLATLFDAESRATEEQMRFYELVDDLISDVTDSIVTEADTELPNLNEFVAVYQNCLNELAPDFGLPGTMFVESQRDILS